MKLTLITNDHIRLRQVSAPVTLTHGRKTARALTVWLDKFNRSGRALKAVGIAAVQFGILERVCVVCMGGYLLPFINPRIVRQSTATVRLDEGCLSFPGQVIETVRHVWVDVEADNLPTIERFGPAGLNEWSSEKLLLSQCVQHEISHCFGLTLFDFKTENSPSPTTWHTLEKA